MRFMIECRYWDLNLKGKGETLQAGQGAVDGRLRLGAVLVAVDRVSRKKTVVL